MATHYRYCAGITKEGKPCPHNGNCPVHRVVNDTRRRKDDEQAMAKLREKNRAPQLPLWSWPQIQAMIQKGYDQEGEPPIDPCGCQG